MLASTRWPPSHITSADTRPSTVVDAEPSTLVMVSDFITFCSSRSTPRGEDAGLALFGVIALDHAHAAQRLGQPAGNLGVDLAALAEDGANRLEAILQDKDERAHHGEDRQRDRDAAMQQIEETPARRSACRPQTPPGPVPTRLRTPSTSVMMRATSVPVRFSS